MVMPSTGEVEAEDEEFEVILGYKVKRERGNSSESRACLAGVGKWRQLCVLMIYAKIQDESALLLRSELIVTGNPEVKLRKDGLRPLPPSQFLFP